MFTSLFWKKVWTWIKHHWYWPVILLLLSISFIAGSSSRKKLFNLLNKQKKNYEKELQIVEEATKEKDKKKTEIFTGHLDQIKTIEREHSIKVKDLEEKKQKELAVTIEENKNKPDDLAREVAKLLSAAYHEKNR
tara:strand:+ start:664 stop:1068 length:405 start_codon:yes stop_codon:yes gene_type:complete